MDNKKIELGLIKEKIKREMECLSPDKYLEKIKVHIENDTDIERLTNVLESLEYYQEKQKKEMKMNSREYWNKKKIENRHLGEEYIKDCDILGRMK